MYKKILVAVDGSDTSLRGLDEAIRLARATGGQVRIVHVVNGLITDASLTPPMYDAVIGALREAGSKLLEQVAEVARRAEIPFEQKLLETIGGRAADEIVREARHWPADLIVLGTHGRRGIKRLVMGSDAELVLRLSPVPVLMVRDRPEA